eukprot:CAMPEP_0198685082 /NCGR_PEP_ID=MMETSP1468-20131203/13129_1 /TAXON_ID=1461545 /ORGANISM="Mantoniella sp, Strain CCMP1436" /LENGTH=136 /DNA_ID=CAMNT_0044430345 /DNA_START=142 /DNA_END=548 /DNA_ORIENTATION=+
MADTIRRRKVDVRRRTWCVLRHRASLYSVSLHTLCPHRRPYIASYSAASPYFAIFAPSPPPSPPRPTPVPPPPPVPPPVPPPAAARLASLRRLALVCVTHPLSLCASSIFARTITAALDTGPAAPDMEITRGGAST